MIGTAASSAAPASLSAEGSAEAERAATVSVSAEIAVDKDMSAAGSLPFSKTAEFLIISSRRTAKSAIFSGRNPSDTLIPPAAATFASALWERSAALSGLKEFTPTVWSTLTNAVRSENRTSTANILPSLCMDSDDLHPPYRFSHNSIFSHSFLHHKAPGNIFQKVSRK